MIASHPSPLIVGIHPTTGGFGWVVMDGPERCLDWGITSHSPYAEVERSLAQLRDVLHRFRPEILALEDWSERREPTRSRIEPFMEKLGELAADRSVTVHVHRRREVHRALGLAPDAERTDILRVVLAHLAMFRHRRPNDRQPWQSPDRRLSLFLAAAMALTSYRNDESIAA